MPLDNSTICQPANGAIVSPPSATRATPSVAEGAGTVGDPGGLYSEHRGLPLPRERRHACPRVTVALTGLVPHMCDHVDVGRLRTQISSARMVFRDVLERIERVGSHRVLMRDLVDHRVVEVSHRL